MARATPKNPTARTLGLGAVAGIRSMTAPALLSRSASRGALAGIAGTPFAPLASPRTARILALLAVGEAVGDKLWAAPDRVSVPGLLGRILSGALVGAALFASEGQRGTGGGALGLAEDALALPIPPGVGDVRVARGRVTLYREVQQ